MSTLVTLIVLAYLLVIAVCVAVWSALSARSTDVEDPVDAGAGARREGTADDRSFERGGRYAPSQPATHDAYRGAHARFAPPATPDRAPADRAGSAAVDPHGSIAKPSMQDRLFAAHARAAPAPFSNSVRVADTREARERTSRDGSSEPVKERKKRDDAFDRFLRANEELDR